MAAVLRAGEGIVSWCERYAGWILLALLLWAAVLRVHDWGVHWVNADEGIYWAIATADAERAAAMIRSNAHPPLYYWFLRMVRGVGYGVEAMRGVSLAAGLLLPVLVFLLGRRWAGPAAGVFAALLVVNAPGAVGLSQVMRPYALHFVLLALGMLFLFRFLDAGRLGDVAGLGASWAVAMLVHYSTFLVLAGTCAYVGWLALARQVERVRWGTLAPVFAGLAGLAFWLYLTHIAPFLVDSALQAQARDGWLRPRFADGPLAALQSYAALPVYLFGEPVHHAIPWLVPAAVLLPPAAARRRPALLALAMLAGAVALSLLGLYPFGPGRHSNYLVVAMAPAAGAALVGLLRSPRSGLVLLGMTSLVLAVIGAVDRDVGIHELTVRRADVSAVVKRLREQSRPGDLVLMDLQTHSLLIPAFAEPPDPIDLDAKVPVSGFESAGRAYAFLHQWVFRQEPARDDLADLLEALATDQPDTLWDPSVRPAWLVQGGWGAPLAVQLPEALPDGRNPCADRFVRPGLAICRLDPDAYRDHAASLATPPGSGS